MITMNIKNLDPKVANLWAKKKAVNGQQLWLPLIAHLSDTEKTIEWLWNNWLSDGTKQAIATNIYPNTPNIDSTTALKLVKFIGFTHDLGKATPLFQRKSARDGDTAIDDVLIDRLIRSGFTGLDTAKFTYADHSPHATAGEALLMANQIPESVAAIIGGHHGDAGNTVPFDQIKNYPPNYRQNYGMNAEDRTHQANWQQVQTQIFNLGLKEAGFTSVKEIPEIKQSQAILLEGLLIMADWLSSGETLNDKSKQPLFPLIPIDQGLNTLDLDKRFDTAIHTWNLGGQWEPKPVDTDTDPYYKRWGFKARPVQIAITQTIQQADDPSIAIIEAPMGIGKTEIALVAAEQMAYKTKRGGLFVGLPTQATSNAMFERVQDWLKELAKHQHKNFPVKLMHGKAEFNDEYTKLPEAANIYENDTKDDGAVVVNEWFTGKKSILSKFSVGTIDNLLLMALKQKHLFLKHLGFSEKVVVIDEVHAYDSFMNQYLYEALKWLGAYHVPVVILSATLPKQKRVELIEAYNQGKFGVNHELQSDTANWQDSNAYPLLTLLNGDTIQQVSQFPGISDQKPTQLSVTRMSADEPALVKAVLTAIQNGGVAGIIVNTVQRAQEIAELVPDNIATIVLHSAFLAPDRADKEQAVQTAIGKRATRPDKLIVIGTQVLEQSLDIDFDVLYTDMAPMDLLLQRAGRLHRHDIDRPQALQTPKMFVMGAITPGDYGKANEAVYEKYLLLKTDHYLPDQINLPGDISKLVQQTYDMKHDPDMPDIEYAKADFEKHLAEEQRKAQVYRLGDPNRSRRDTLHMWLQRRLSNNTEDQQTAAAAVRDIQPSLEIILLQRKADGIYLLNGTPIDQCSSKLIAEQLIRLPLRIIVPITKALESLETSTNQTFPHWQTNKWLKNSLALILDDQLTTELGTWHLQYSANDGLKCTKEA